MKNSKSVEREIAKRRMRKLMILLIVLLAAVTVIYGGLRFMGRAVDTSSKATELFRVEQGQDAASIGAALEKAGLIRSGKIFLISTKLNGSASGMKAGTYAFSKAMSMSQILSDIVNGKTAGNTFTVTEGMSTDKIAALLQRNGICKSEDFFSASEKIDVDKYSLSAAIDKSASPNRLEGFLYPDTYEVPVDASPKEVIDTMLKNFDRHIGGEIYKKAASAGMSIRELITKASIIQREAGVKKDMPTVASVINNRLSRDMYLQMDSILSYITKEDKVIASYGDTKIASKYNPYTNKGLPPGPICSPGMDAIDAALSPANTEYLFFVDSAKLDGTLAFSDNDVQFMKDKAAFEKAYAASQEKNND